MRSTTDFLWTTGDAIIQNVFGNKVKYGRRFQDDAAYAGRYASARRTRT